MIYITRDNTVHGPYSEAEAYEHFKAGQLLQSDLASTDGKGNWKPLLDVLFTQKNKTPVPIPENLPAVSPVKNTTKIKWMVPIVGIAFSIGVFLLWNFGKNAKSTQNSKAINAEVEQKPTPTATSRTREVNIDVFVVTKAHENIKLGLATVEVAPYDVAKAALSKWLEERAERNATYTKAQSGALLRDLLEALYSPDFAFKSCRQNISQIEAATKTDADGRCSVTIPTGQKYVLLVAKKSGGITKSDIDYYWIVEIPETANTQNKILLSNDNLLIPNSTVMGLNLGAL